MTAEIRVTARRERWYVVAIAVLTAGGVALSCLAAAGAGPVVLVIIAGLTLSLLLRFARQLVDAVLQVALPPPRPLPRLDFRDGIDPAYRTAIVYPVIVHDAAQIAGILDVVAANLRGNQDPSLVHALLVDFADAGVAALPGDQRLWSALLDGVRQLNESALAPGAPPVIALRRTRRWNDRDRVWMGWERKRGKLEELNRLVLGSRTTSFETGAGTAQPLAGVRFVLTLDEDTRLLPGTARQLVETLAHPRNAPVLDAAGRLVAGYGMLRPRAHQVAGGRSISWFQRLAYSLSPGPPAPGLRASVYQDAFDRDVFLGQGLYDVAAFQALLDGRIPENAVLSHDKLEGMYVRTALVSDAVVCIGPPANYLVYRRVSHRWARGDWLLLRWLFAGRRSPLGVLDRWQLLSDLNRPVSFVAALAVSLLAWHGVLPGSTLGWTALAAGSLASPLVLRPVQGVVGVRTPGGGRAREGLGATARAVRRLAATWGMWLILLPDLVLCYCDAIARASYRLAVSRRRVLQWETSTRATSRLRGSGAAGYWRAMAGAPVLAALVTGSLLAVRPAALWFVWPALLAWALSPQLAYRLGRPWASAEPATVEPGAKISNSAAP